MFATPSGKAIDVSHFPQFPDVSAETSADALSSAAADVNSRTCIPDWRGKDSDYGMAIEALLQRDDRMSAIG